MKMRTTAAALVVMTCCTVRASSLDEKCQALAERWQDRFGAARVEAIVAPPFVIAGDGGATRLARYRDRTILAAASALRSTYFRTEPTEPVLILLFESGESYRRLAKLWFGHTDIPHFGFYRHHDRVMLMNVGTGTGTLVHELVHALIEPDFPDVPDWFNEGLASLYEQCSIDGQTIRGLTNWRLAALQQAIRDKTLRPIEQMIADQNFRDGRLTGINYAQARYLLMYLQEKNLLRDYYTRFRDAVGDDPNGLATLAHVLAPRSIEDFEKDWRTWVLTLRFGE